MGDFTDDSGLANTAEQQTHLETRFNRRGEARHTAILRAGLIYTAEGQEPCVVRNISPGGLSARIYKRLAWDQPVRVELRPGELLDGAVIWARDWDIGIAFAQPIDVKAVLASRWITEHDRQRRLPRVKFTSLVHVKLGEERYDALLCDISQGGAKIQTREPLPYWGEIVLMLDDFPPVAGLVRWQDDTLVGLSFSESIPSDVLARWIRERRDNAVPPAAEARTLSGERRH